MKTGLALFLATLAAEAAALSGCQHHAPPAGPPAIAHYVVGPPWQGRDGAWFYPREQSGFDSTGLAVVDHHRRGDIVADGERYDPDAMTASVQTLPLPSVLRVHDLETGRIVYVRAIGRGPDDPGRLIALSPAAARALGVRDGAPAQVAVTLDARLSQQGQNTLAGAPKLAIDAAPVGAVTEQSLGPPGAASAAVPSVVDAATGPVEGGGIGASAPAAIPAGVQQGAAMPGALWLDGGRFENRSAAQTVADAIGGEARRDGAGRQAVFTVRAGPFRSVSEADAALDRARHSGVTGAHIIVE
ncbi:SPOR domain-containing protein [Acetobacteraceae bacterium KSS8]|uniref:SPOR domain-containing protein n=1 Tax=Endosaccharibacter trunci TaxID=2812733 RepID=A0ABT1W722_9PROT|nr:SPOR domain-containing protein [Acetobacteraceae bacterium KSS8]